MLSPDAALFRRFTRALFAGHHAVLRHGDVAAAPFGHTSARWRVLDQIVSGNAYVGDIARATGYSRQAVQRLTDALVADGHAAYRPDPDDRRRQLIELTDAGRGGFARLEASYATWAPRLVAEIGADDLATVCHLLERIAEQVQSDVPHLQEELS